MKESQFQHLQSVLFEFFRFYEQLLSPEFL
jgi:hypothetical protein